MYTPATPWLYLQLLKNDFDFKPFEEWSQLDQKQVTKEYKLLLHKEHKWGSNIFRGLNNSEFLFRQNNTDIEWFVFLVLSVCCLLLAKYLKELKNSSSNCNWCSELVLNACITCISSSIFWSSKTLLFIEVRGAQGLFQYLENFLICCS